MVEADGYRVTTRWMMRLLPKLVGPRPRMRREPDRLWGFGWTGVVLAFVAVGLLWALLFGVDLRFWLMSVIARVLGGDAMMFFVGWVLPPHSFDFFWLSYSGGGVGPPTTRFGLVPMVCVLTALRIQPWRVGGWSYVLVVGAGVLLPIVGLAGTAFVTRYIMGWPAGRSLFHNHETHVIVNQTACCVLAIAAMAIALRAWAPLYVAAVLLVTGTLCELNAFLSINSSPFVDPLGLWAQAFEWSWCPAWFIGLVGWAVRARVRAPRPGCCVWCGYDVKGQGGVCPECGREAGP
jgi:hypothetical protein